MKQGTMSITHESMMALTAHMPMKTIEISGDPYLERYFAHMLADGTQIWYHRFLRNDPERHLHTHPWFARSTILVGGYVEDRDVDGRVVRIGYSARDTNAIGFCTLHRIVEVEPDTWTMMIVSPGRQPHWHFVEEDGSRTEMPTSPFEWHQDFKPRADAQPQVPEGFRSVDIVNAGFEGCINLFWKDYPLALVPKEIAREIKAVLSAAKEESCQK